MSYRNCNKIFLNKLKIDNFDKNLYKFFSVQEREKKFHYMHILEQRSNFTLKFVVYPLRESIDGYKKALFFFVAKEIPGL